MGRNRRIIEKDIATCGDCSNGVWNDAPWNISQQDGKPITKHCPFYQNGKYGVTRTFAACEHYKSNN